MAGTPTPEKADLAELTKTDVPGSIHEKGTYLQRSGVKLFLWLLYLTSGILVALFVFLLLSTFLITNVPADPLEAAKYIADQRDVAFTRFLGGVERLVLNFCLPLMTGVLGYVFGTRESGRRVRED
jgi:hypothetical protein